ncbi:MAG TPA: magnesium/cobalt transporter CorA [Candidatus Binatia bacterium]|nr:magnesium/cobalt transporter CorA [Candidatus Binatia bacterium]
MIINCVAYQDGKRLAEIEARSIHEYVDRPGCFVWVALRDATPAELETMQEEFGLHPLAVEDARHGHERPKLEEYGDSLFAVLHVIEHDGADLAVGELDIFAGRNYVLSVRNRAQRGFQDVRARCEREPELLRNGSGYVLYTLMDAVVDRYFPALDALESELDRCEERIFAGNPNQANIQALYYVKQKLVTLKHAVGPLLEASGKLHGGRVPSICAGLQEYFRDVYDHLVRLNQEIDSLREMTSTAMAVHLSLSSTQENETTKRLAAYAALVAVPTMIAGLYGMNFEHMPEIKWRLGYPVTLATMVLIDAWLYWRFRKAGWL